MRPKDILYILCVLICGTAASSAQFLLNPYRFAAATSGPPSTNLVQNLDASTTAGGSAEVLTWTAATGKNATGTTGTVPLSITAGKNGLNTVRFDGVDNTMATAAFDSALSQPFYAAIVYKQTSVSGTPISRMIDGLSGGTRGLLLRVSDWIECYSGTGFTTLYTTGMTTNFRMLSVEVNGASSKRRLDGGTRSTFTANGTDGLTGITVGTSSDGATNPFDGEIAEILIYSGTKDDTAETEIRTYLNTKWAVY